MKEFVFCSLFFLVATSAVSQNSIPVNEQQLENIADTENSETEDDNDLQELEQFIKHPLSINSASREELRQLKVLSDLQIENLVNWRELMGKLISIYELQAIPGWDLATIRKVSPYLSIVDFSEEKKNLIARFKKGEHSLLLRISRVLETSKGYKVNTGENGYIGDPQKILFRYKYNYKNLLQYGLLGDKDAGESFFKGAQRMGFDFYSAHLFIRKIGVVQHLAIGDFTVNMGQGLIHWQSLAFKKSADVLSLKRQAAALRPYHAAGEFYFHRGFGITLKKKKMEATGFYSLRKLSANFDSDTLSNESYVSSLLTSGNHRNRTEQEKRNTLKQTVFGGNLLYRNKKWHLGLNAVAYLFSAPMKKRDEPYNKFAITGASWFNHSIDYSFTYKNIHLFGEAALDPQLDRAFINGLLMSVDPKVDLSILYRKIDPRYQAINGNAFTENSTVSNESGLFTGFSIRPISGWRLNFYFDSYHFPWLKYLVDAPSRGRDILGELVYSPNKQTEIHTRYRVETKQVNEPDNITPTNHLVWINKKNWRFQVNHKLVRDLTLRLRTDFILIHREAEKAESGFQGFIDILYKPLMKPYDLVLRLQTFETDGYDSRLYAYENDVLYSYAIPALYDKGFRYYINCSYDLGKKIKLWLRWAQTIYRGKAAFGSGLDEIDGNRRSELKIQARWIF